MYQCSRRFAAALAAAVLPLFFAASSRAANPNPVPSPTLAEDLTKLTVPLLPTYESAKHPRLLFSAEDKAALQQKAKANPDFWKPVLASAKRLASVPDAATIKSGAKYWRIEEVESGALVHFLTGDKKSLDDCLAWMIPHCQEKTWGTGFRDNVDLQASWYLYHLSIAYDILHDDIPEADRKIIVDGLTSHAKAIYESCSPDSPENKKNKYSFDQNHTYIPAVALSAASLALLGEVPEAKDWLKMSYTLLNRSRYVLGNDGYYYEGFGYWFYAMHWHVRYADLMSRATGEHFLDLPILQKNWNFALQLSLPGNPGAFDIDDTSRYSGSQRPAVKPVNYGIFWDLAKNAAAHDRNPTPGASDVHPGLAGDDKTTADFYHDRVPDLDYPAANFLWYAPNVTPAPFSKIAPYHYFADADVITWRSGWDKDATCFLFRCGPPEGHAAAEKIQRLKDWGMNAGHVHPDVGAFYLYAKGTYLAVATGYTAEKWTKDHNTLLVDGKGQGDDGTYWNDRGIPYSTLNKARITAQFLCDDYAFAAGDFGAIYTHTPGVQLHRAVLVTKKFLLVVDDMAADSPHKLTWLVHSNTEFKHDGAAYVSAQDNASLAVLPLAPADALAQPAVTTVMAGAAPGKGTATQRGYQLGLTAKNAAKATRFVTLLAPLAAGEKAPAIEAQKLDGGNIALKIKGSDGKIESVTLDIAWKNTKAGPAVISEK